MTRWIALLLTLTTLVAGCSQPMGFAWGESDQAALACEVWSAAAEYWQEQGEQVQVVCTTDAGVEVTVGKSVTRAWLTGSAAEGGELLGVSQCGGYSLEGEKVAGCASYLGDAFVSTYGAEGLGETEAACKLSWVAAHELGHVLGHEHAEQGNFAVMAPKIAANACL